MCLPLPPRACTRPAVRVLPVLNSRAYAVRRFQRGSGADRRGVRVFVLLVRRSGLAGELSGPYPRPDHGKEKTHVRGAKKGENPAPLALPETCVPYLFFLCRLYALVSLFCVSYVCRLFVPFVCGVRIARATFVVAVTWVACFTVCIACVGCIGSDTVETF